MLWKRLCAAAIGLTLIFSAPAQTPTAQVTGRVTDASDAVVPGASVVLVNTETGLIGKAVSNDTGYYTVSLLPPGEYRLRVQKEGFRTVTRAAVTLVVDQVARLDFQLDVGS